MNNDARDTGQEGGTGYDLLDFMFTVAISLGLTPELLQQQHLTGILSELWIKEDRLPSGVEWFRLGVVFLGILTLTLSWAGYRVSVRKQPPKLETILGTIRFVTDILLVIAYGFILIRYKNFVQVMIVLTIILFVYALWDILKRLEHREKYITATTGQVVRDLVWWPFALALLLLTTGLVWWQFDQLLALMGAMVCVALPRVLKIRLPRAGG